LWYCSSRHPWRPATPRNDIPVVFHLGSFATQKIVYAVSPASLPARRSRHPRRRAHIDCYVPIGAEMDLFDKKMQIHIIYK
jgi:hypothetical protein